MRKGRDREGVSERVRHVIALYLYDTILVQTPKKHFFFFFLRQTRDERDKWGDRFRLGVVLVC